MAQCEALIDTLKNELKARRMTYADVAQGLNMSEANIKRMFAEKKFSLQRLEDVCRLIKTDITGLVRLYDETRSRITYLTKDQEKELVSDVKLLMIAVSVRNHSSFEDIVSYYDVSKSECIQYLAKLDRLHLIELLPNNRIKLLINEDFHWLPNGPIEKFFEKKMQPDFLNTDFSGKNEFRIFLNGALTQSSHEVLLRKLKRLSMEFQDLHLQDISTPHHQKMNESLLIAFRPWQYSGFEKLRRK